MRVIFSHRLLAVAAVCACVAAQAQTYKVGHVERQRILIDQRYDAHPSQEAEQLIAPYRAKVDSVMKPVVGRAARDLERFRPESPLSNLLTDILVDAGKAYGEKPDFGVYNMGGIRATLAQGDVTYEDVLNVAPFENKICFVTLTGTDVLQLFREMGGNGGEAVSRQVRLVYDKDGKLVKARIKGKKVKAKKKYRIATIDFVAQGNDNMKAFTKATDVNQLREQRNNVRYIIMNYLERKMKKGIAVDARVEGRVVFRNK